MRPLVPLLFLALTLGACADAQISNEASNVEGKQFKPPAPGRTALYVTNSGNGTFEIFAGQRTLGIIAPSMWLRADLPAGDYSLRCKLFDNQAYNEPISLPAGAMTFVSVRIAHVYSDTPCRFSALDTDQGKAAVLAGRRALQVLDARD